MHKNFFTTPRLIIRKPQAEDGADVYQGTFETLDDIRAQPAYLPWGKVDPSLELSTEFCKACDESYQAGKDFQMVIFTNEVESKFVGMIGLKPTLEFELGYWCRKSMQKQGFIHEAVVGISQFAFAELSAQSIICVTDVNNIASRKVLENASYHLREIIKNERQSLAGEFFDSCLYESCNFSLHANKSTLNSINIAPLKQ